MQSGKTLWHTEWAVGSHSIKDWENKMLSYLQEPGVPPGNTVTLVFGRQLCWSVVARREREERSPGGHMDS